MSYAERVTLQCLDCGQRFTVTQADASDGTCLCGGSLHAIPHDPLATRELTRSERDTDILMRRNRCVVCE